MSKYILAIDQGTTSSRAIIYNSALQALTTAQQELPLSYPEPGWVEQNPHHIWQSVLGCIKQALQQLALKPTDIAAIGITNQRETTLLWHKASGKTLYPAIVWQDRRTAKQCQQLKDTGCEPILQQKTGLLADPYFSATKLGWLLDNIPGARALAEAGELCFGTVDCYLLWQLTGGKVHATDASNASRTLLFNINSQRWDDELLQLFDIPAAILPQVMDNAAHFGITDLHILGANIPILSMIGDQQAALLGQACISPGMSKSTYGTGCFAVVNTGATVMLSQHKLLSTLAWRLEGQSTYALEGSIFMAGATVQWLRDKLGIIQQASDTEALAQQSSYQQTELLIPAFTGLGTPYWRPEINAALFGMTRDTGRAELATAALCSVAYQSRDLLSAMLKDGVRVDSLRVDGGMTANRWYLQALADLSQTPITRCHTTDTTALGAAFLAALQLGYVNNLTDINRIWQSGEQFQPVLPADSAQALYQRWQRACKALIALEL
ncbi:glycerol kinase GlpK [Rheinheimera baltica]|uniref:glycerol kinase GlpK n=1 Tax=Rheinheimera baltica TaxID=67576 RepID=UPI00273EC066|nr:glycerol kinase GlpK [Rheinheimera baltica]MDP5141668.1 glycerol kinase GlpK [Rheinheimera baltica]MDP5151323.1 glycerol kinase GlpK [Rheinheimera baltica]